MNWTVRFKNKTFWVTFIPTTLLLIQLILKLFGIEWNYGTLSDQLVEIVNVLFILLALLGVAVDPTTKGVTDSTQAMTYEKPKEE